MRKNIKIAFFIGIIAALIGSIADVLLLYNPKGGYETGDFLFLKDISLQRLLWGSYLGVLFIPFEIAGFWGIYAFFKTKKKKIATWVLLGAAYITFPGVVYHAALGMAGAQLHQGAENVQHLQIFFEPLSVFLVIGFLLLSVLLFYLFYTSPSLPRWLAFCNPLLIYVLFLLLYLVVPILGNLLIVAGFNLAIAIVLIAIYSSIHKSVE